MKQLPWIPQRGRTSWAGKGGYVSFASVSVDFGLDIGIDMESVNFSQRKRPRYVRCEAGCEDGEGDEGDDVDG